VLEICAAFDAFQTTLELRLGVLINGLARRISASQGGGRRGVGRGGGGGGIFVPL